MMDKNVNDKNLTGFQAARNIAAETETYTFFDPWGVLQTVTGYAAYRQAVSDAREAWLDSVGR